MLTAIHISGSLALRSLGRGALIAKLDVKAAYRLIPVHPEDRPLLGIEWRGAQYVDAMLPFGLCSAPKIFTAVADGLEWILRQRGIRHIDHYLDDIWPSWVARMRKGARAHSTDMP